MILSGGTVPEKVYMSYRAQKVSTLSPESKAHAGEWGTGEDRVFTIINSGSNTAGGRERSIAGNYFEHNSD